jgi:transcriptional regulator NrdR family protein
LLAAAWGVVDAGVKKLDKIAYIRFTRVLKILGSLERW